MAKFIKLFGFPSKDAIQGEILSFWTLVAETSSGNKLPSPHLFSAFSALSQKFICCNTLHWPDYTLSLMGAIPEDKSDSPTHLLLEVRQRLCLYKTNLRPGRSLKQSNNLSTPAFQPVGGATGGARNPSALHRPNNPWSKSVPCQEILCSDGMKTPGAFRAPGQVHQISTTGDYGRA